MVRLRNGLSCVFALAALILLAPFAGASSVRPVGLAEMAARADRIFLGVCTDAVELPSDTFPHPATRFRFRVVEAFFGVQDQTVEFSSAVAPGGRGFADFPVFRPGDVALLFLYPESAVGLTTAIGLGQGRFSVIDGPRGQRWIVNSRSNDGLLDDVPETTLQQYGIDELDSTGPLALEKLRGVLNELLASRGQNDAN